MRYSTCIPVGFFWLQAIQLHQANIRIRDFVERISKACRIVGRLYIRLGNGQKKQVIFGNSEAATLTMVSQLKDNNNNN